MFKIHQHFSGERKEIRPPYDHKSVVGYYYEATRDQVKEAISVNIISINTPFWNFTNF